MAEVNKRAHPLTPTLSPSEGARESRAMLQSQNSAAWPSEDQSAPRKLLVRIHGSAELPTLVYLPGLHGNWTLIGNFRKALGGRVRFVEISYPPTLTWTLEEYSAGVESALLENGIVRGWVLAESFGSQVVWPMLGQKGFQTEGLILAGGFVQHPMRWAVRLAERVCGELSFSMIILILFGYAKLSRWRFRNSPETNSGIQEFIDSLTELDRQAAKHRLRLVAQSNPCAIARQVGVPLYALTGLFDPVVPWFWVRRWLRKNCPALREYRIISHADHNVLGTGATAAAEQILKWMADTNPARSASAETGSSASPRP
jgi:pimeloyl-ACP methyl ester carboxylesterase